ncbi:hypothetical protein JIX56_40045 [Streptomyces sp. CA-210063]|nr:hypothetical protein [Streptomyces sp. CA-210063]UUU37445.1 hypothetical protein JIX56_40045 [Streptomyces sp. CA-210063]
MVLLARNFGRKLGCEIGDLLIPEPQKVTRPGDAATLRVATPGCDPTSA